MLSCSNYQERAVGVWGFFFFGGNNFCSAGCNVVLHMHIQRDLHKHILDLQLLEQTLSIIILRLPCLWSISLLCYFFRL